MIKAADEILQIVQHLRLTRLDIRCAEAAFRTLDGHGVVIESPDEFDESHRMDDAPPPAGALVRVRVDPSTVLRDVLAPLGYALGEKKTDFVLLQHPDIASKISLFFLENSAIPPHAILPFSSAVLTVVVHVASSLTPEYDKIAIPTGLHVVRLRDLGSLDSGTLSGLVAKVEALRSAHVSPATSSEVAALVSEYEMADPALVERYASTQKETLFEGATAKIMSPLMEHILVLGGRFRGCPIPDGLLFQGNQVATYDCKSKNDASYSMDPPDADQQSRYLDIQQRLQESPFKFHKRGTVMFVPHIDRDDFEKKSRKEFWARLTQGGAKLLVIPARTLLRLHQLTSTQDTGFSLYFSTARFWKALFDENLGDLADDLQIKLMGDRGRCHRIIDPQTAELAWLAALAGPVEFIHTIASALQHTDRDSTIEERVRRPILIQRYLRALRAPAPSFESLGKATTLSTRGISYLLLNSDFEAKSREEFGKKGVENLDRLREEAKALASLGWSHTAPATVATRPVPGTNGRQGVKGRPHGSPAIKSNLLNSAAQPLTASRTSALQKKPTR